MTTTRAFPITVAFVALGMAIGCSSAPTGYLGGGGGDDGGGSSSSSSSSSSSGGSSSSAGSTSGSSGGQGASSGAASSSGSGSSSGSQTSSGGSGSSGASSSGASSSSSSSSSSSGGSNDGGASADALPAGDGAADGANFQAYNLQLINMYRAMMSLAPYVLDPTLSAFALAGSTELTMDHSPHQHFINAGNAIFSMGFNTMAGENQGDPNGWRVMATDPTTNEMDQIQAIIAAMFAEGPGTGTAHGHYENIMSTSFTRVGIGLVEVSNKLYLTNDFSN